VTEQPKEPKSPPPYRRVADKLRAEIKAGKPGRGEALPTAMELSKRFKVGKTTIHRAFAVLQAEGLVEIRAGIGVSVRNWTPILRDANKRLAGQQWGRGHSIWEADLGDRPMNVETKPSFTTKVPQEVRDLLDVPRYLVRDRVFTVERERIQLATSYLDADLMEGTTVAEVDTGAGGTFARLKELGLEPTHFCEDIRIRAPLLKEEEALRIGPNRTVIEILRENATEDGRVVEVTHMILVADAYVLRYHIHS
jgi:GntR family transcriptional regulator